MNDTTRRHRLSWAWDSFQVAASCEPKTSLSADGRQWVGGMTTRDPSCARTLLCLRRTVQAAQGQGQDKGPTRDGAICLPAGLGAWQSGTGFLIVTCTPQRTWSFVTAPSPVQASHSAPQRIPALATPLPSLFPCHALANPSTQVAVFFPPPNPKRWDSLSALLHPDDSGARAILTRFVHSYSRCSERRHLECKECRNSIRQSTFF